MLLALAAADALGAATEMQSPERVAARFPDGLRRFEGGSPFGFAPGEATDDTQMALATLCGLLEAGGQDGLKAVLAHYRDWVTSSPPDVGNLTMQALRRAGQVGVSGGMQVWARGGMDNAGNGGLMRVAAVWVAGLSGSALLEAAATTTALTHADPRCVLGSVFLCALLERLAGGEAYPQAVSPAWADALALDLPGVLDGAGLFTDAGLDAARYGELLAERRALVETAILKGASGVAALQTGFVLHTLQAALAHNLNAPDWVTVAERAALAGDDSDTAGAVAGAVAGARGFTVPAALLPQLRIGASWGDWQRGWEIGALDRYFG